jgi:membrane protein
MKNPIRLTFKELGGLFKTASVSWFNKDPFRESAVIAYYAVFSIPGLLMLIITATGYFFGKETVSETLFAQVTHTMGLDAAKQFRDIIEHTGQAHATVWATVAGIIILLVGATGVFVELQKIFNRIWEVKAAPKKGILTYLKARLFSFGLIVAIAFLLLISLVISAALAAMNEWIITDASSFVARILNAFSFLLSLTVISLLFAIMFKMLPDAKIRWRLVWPGALLTGLLFTGGKTLLALYFGKLHPASVYGAAGSLILFLLWVSYSSLIVFFGAEFTAAYSKLITGRTIPSAIAVNAEPDHEKQDGQYS